MAIYGKAQPGLDHYACACRNHVFAYPQHDEMQEWEKYRVTHPVVRSILEKKGMLVDTPPPPPLPHVILVSPADAHLLGQKRWRVVRTSSGKRVRYEVKRAPRSQSLQLAILPDAEVVAFVLGDGTDCRREALKATTMKEVARIRKRRGTAAHPKVPMPS